MKAKKQKIVDAVIEDLKKSFETGDYTVLEELLFMIPKNNLIQALPEEDWHKFDYKSFLDIQNIKQCTILLTKILLS